MSTLKAEIKQINWWEEMMCCYGIWVMNKTDSTSY